MTNNLYRWGVILSVPVGIVVFWTIVANLRLGYGPTYAACMVSVVLGAILFTILAMQKTAYDRVSKFAWWAAAILSIVVPSLLVIFGQPGGSTPPVSQEPISLPVKEFDWSNLDEAPVATPVATTPVSLSPPPPADYRQEWVRLMEKRIDVQHRALASTGLAPQFWPQNLEPVSSITLQPGEARFTGQVLDGGQKSHVWLNYSGNRKEMELCGTVHQSKWFAPRANPSRVFSEPGADVLLVRLKPGITTPMTITAERVMRDGQRDRTDLAMRPAVRKIYRNVPGQTKVAVADIVQTALPSGKRVDSTVTVLLLYGGGLALDPEASVGSLSVDFGTGNWQPSDLKFEATTVGRTNPCLLVSLNHPGVYDIVVVLTPL